MNKKNIVGVRLDDISLNFVKCEAKKSNETMSNWIREQIKFRKLK